MPQYEINVPGSGKYRVDSPTDLSDDQVWQAVQGQIKPVAPVMPSTERTWGEAAKDIGASAVSGIGSLVQMPGQLYGLATGNMGTSQMMDAGKGIQQYGEEMKSAGLKERERLRSENVQRATEEGGQFGAFKTALSETVKDPALLTSFLAEQAPQLVVPLGAARAGVAGARALGAGAEAAGKIGTRAAIGAGAVQQGADVGAGAYEDIYAELKSKGATDAEAAEGAINLARSAGASGALLSLLSNKLPGARKMEEALAGVPGKGSRIATGIKSAAGEIPSEMTEEVGGKGAQNLAMQQVKPDQELTAGFGETAAMAGLGAAGLGGAAGLAQKRAVEPAPEEQPAPPTAETPEPVTPPKAPPTAPVAPVAAAPVTPPAGEPAPEKPAQWDPDYTEGLSPEAGTFFQNRDRSTPASVGQMQSIAADPDYTRLSVSRDFGSGAPVVIADLPISEEQFGKTSFATASDGTRIPVRYAVVNADDLIASNTSDGTKNNEYGDLSVTAIRPIAGNGRVAGLRAAYDQGTATKYRDELMGDTEHGISSRAIGLFENPVLVRVMPKSYVTPNIADISNVSGTLRLSPVEAARNDITRIDLNGLSFNDDGTPNTNSLIQFVRAMPKDEQGELMDAKGMPNTKAIDRLNNAIFQKAYGSDTLIELYAQAADPEAKAVLNALARVAPKMAVLEGAGDYDVRQAVIDAAEMAVNARRSGQKLKDYAQQGALGADPYAIKILDMLADNSRSSKRMAEALDRLATAAAEQSQAGGEDMFGEKPQASLDDVYKALTLPPEEGGDLFAPPTTPPTTAAPPTTPAPPTAPVEPKTPAPVEPKPPAPAEPKPPAPVAPKPPVTTPTPSEPKTPEPKAPTEEKPERKEFVIDKTPEQIAQEIRGMRIPDLAKWAIDNAPNSAAKAVAEKVFARIKEFDKKGIMPKKIRIQNDGARNNQGVRGAAQISFVRNRGMELSLRLNGLVNGRSDFKTGTRYDTILHELTHIATQSQLHFMGTRSKEFNDLTVLLAKVKRQLKEDASNKKWSAIRDRVELGSNTVANVHELVAWGMTDADFQNYLSKIKVGEKNAFSRLVEIVRNMLGLNVEYETALDSLVRTTESLLEMPMSEIIQGIAPEGAKLQPFKQKVGESAQVVEQEQKTGQPPLFFFDSLFKEQTAEERKNGFANRFNNPVTLKDGSRLSGFTDPAKQTTFHGYDKNGERFTQRASSVNPDDIVSSRDSNRTAEKLREALIDAFGPKEEITSEMNAGDIKGKAKQALQKRAPMDTSAMSDVDPDFIKQLEPIFNPQSKTIVDRIDGLKDNFWKKVAQGVADQYRAIKDYDPKAYMMARISKTIDGGLEGLMFHGHVFNDDGALNIKKDTKGLIDALKPVGKETDRYMMWIALNRDSRLPEDKRSIDPEITRRRNELARGTINGKSRLEVYQSVQKDMNAINKSVLDIARETGLIDQAGYEKFSQDIFYVPFYRAMEDGDVQGAQTSAGLTSQQFSKQLMGGQKAFGDLMENTLRNWSHILSASMKNQAARASLAAAEQVNAAYPIEKQQKGSVKVMIDGQPVFYDVDDPLLLEAITSIGYMGPKSKFLDVARNFKNMLQFGVTISPAFKIRNLFRDSVSAIAITDLKKNPFANIVEGWAASNKDNPAHISALAGGAIFNFGSAYEGDQAKLVKRLLKQGVKEEHILDTPEKIKSALAKSWDLYQEWGNKSEAANRQALYDQMRKKNMSHLEASFYARDMLDFSMQGSWPAFRFLTQVVPFLNARVQGLYKLGRDGITPTARVIYNTATGKEIEGSDKVKAQAFSIVTSAVALASLALYAAFKDDEDFQKRDEWDRDNFWWFKLPGMDFAFRIPKPFEIGAFGTMAERTAEQIFDQGAEGKQFSESLTRMLADTFSLNPTPQLFKPLIDLYSNKDSFTGAPIESAGMERLSKQERVNDATSPLAILLGGIANVALPEKAELSPVQVDYTIKAYFGWLGGTAAWASHYAVMPFAEGTRPDNKWTDTLSAGFVKSLPSNQSRYVTAFYENSKEISQAYADMRHYAEIGDSAKVQEMLEEKGDKIKMAKFYDKTAKDMSEVRRAIRVITADTEMPGDQKREEIDRLKQLVSELARQAEETRKSLKE